MASSSARYRPKFVYFEPYSTTSRLLNRATTAGTLQTDAVAYTTVPFQNQQDVAKEAHRGNLTPVALLPLCCLTELRQLTGVVGYAQ
ncbi:hypothetical protein DPV78_001161 [Talaromyces pinophilus]|jgi:hypothetical protein|nr:hypothetical protein DPV78_001161 [Talaromyces pinophilus]